MKLYPLLLTLLLSSCASNHKPAEIPLTFEEVHESLSQDRGPLLFLIQSGKIKEAIDFALTNDQNLDKNSLLNPLGLCLLERGASSNSEKDIFFSLYGIQLSGNEEALAKAYQHISSPYPELQLLTVQVLSTYNTDEANHLLEQALMSDYLLIRLEAAFAIASKKLPNATSQIESLFAKVDPGFRPIFAELFAMLANPASEKMLKRLLRDSNERVRLEAIHAICRMGLTDLQPDLKALYSDNFPAIQEAVCASIGSFQVASSKELLENFKKSNFSTTRLSALFASYELGDDTSRRHIEQEALEGNLFAIGLLGKMKGSEDILSHLMHSPDSSVRVNSAIELLKLKDPRSVDGLHELFIQNPKDLVFEEMVSQGKTLSFYKLTPSASENVQRDSYLFEISLRLREELLVKALELDEDSFIELAQLIFEKRQLDLVPTLIRLLENLRSDKAIALLKEQSECLGCPLIRAYANLALYRLHEEGPYFMKVNDWVKNNIKLSLTEIRPQLPWMVVRQEKSPYTLSLEEQASLLLESLDALAQSRDPEGLKTLLIAIRDGNPQNRYLLAGLLLRASQ